MGEELIVDQTRLRKVEGELVEEWGHAYVQALNKFLDASGPLPLTMSLTSRAAFAAGWISCHVEEVRRG